MRPQGLGMGLEHVFEKIMTMDDAAWERHASPWSVWTRVTLGLPLLLGAIASHHWIGWWAVPVIAVVWFLIWLNPRAFPPPASTDNWAARATFGERVWLNRDKVPIPSHHARWAIGLSVLAGAGFVVAVIGAVIGDWFSAVTGGIVGWFAKMWFCDRMVWLYQDMIDADPRYRTWLR